MRVVVGLSGGVDSSVAAHLLVEEGHEVIGLFMRNWNDESVTINNECPWIDDANDAMLVANHLGIPFQVMDLSAEYKERIVDYMFAEYAAGRTPNPDVLCNREVKFDLFSGCRPQIGRRCRGHRSLLPTQHRRPRRPPPFGRLGRQQRPELLPVSIEPSPAWPRPLPHWRIGKAASPCHRRASRSCDRGQEGQPRLVLHRQGAPARFLAATTLGEAR